MEIFVLEVGSKETLVSKWYDTLNPILTEAVDDMTEVACSASDISQVFMKEVDVLKENESSLWDSNSEESDGEQCNKEVEVTNQKQWGQGDENKK